MPRTITARDDNDAGRTHSPLTLAWALAPWKAQGMTLAKALLHITQAAASPGVLFTAMTRVRHPDTLMLDDEFPSYRQIMKVRSNPNFQLRLDWERKARVKFSKTIRRHMRDPSEYSAEKAWTQEESDLADVILADYARNHNIGDDDFAAHGACTCTRRAGPRALSFAEASALPTLP